MYIHETGQGILVNGDLRARGAKKQEANCKTGRDSFSPKTYHRNWSCNLTVHYKNFVRDIAITKVLLSVSCHIQYIRAGSSALLGALASLCGEIAKNPLVLVALFHFILYYYNYKIFSSQEQWVRNSRQFPRKAKNFIGGKIHILSLSVSPHHVLLFNIMWCMPSQFYFLEKKLLIDLNCPAQNIYIRTYLYFPYAYKLVQRDMFNVHTYMQ